MQQDDHSNFPSRGERSTIGTSALAENAVSLLSKRQTKTGVGARQFVLDYLLRSISGRTEFDAGRMLDELRGHRLSVDSVIDIYVPAVARLLGELWMENKMDFASVTVGSMRLQALLAVASSEALDFLRPADSSHYMLIAIPEGEQHTLGAFVLAAQLRRMGARVDVSFCERVPDMVSRVICDTPDMILFSASCKTTLATVSQLVLDISKVVPQQPLMAVGGHAAQHSDLIEDMIGIDLVTSKAKEALAFVARHQKPKPNQAYK